MKRPNGACAVFLDRDGVINEVIFRNGKPASPRSMDEFRLVDGIRAELDRLRAAGLRLFVVTNQPDVARGLLAPDILDAMTERILAELPVERVLVCPHDNADGCPCRKPQPGMLLEVARCEGVLLTQSYLIGDSWKDIEAARNARCRGILLRREYNRQVRCSLSVDTLQEAVDLILRGES
ncbi:MAG: HAD family hydrolase [Planctomycetes bacterium]|nr:HAD family hydrolase [Planctomycetota bacterium]